MPRHVIVPNLTESQVIEEKKFIRKATNELVQDPELLNAFLKKAGFKIQGKRIVPSRKASI